MGILTVEEGGARRSFRVGDGVLSIGSGEAAVLRLESEGVAELHAELVVRAGRPSLRPFAGAPEISVAGDPVRGEIELHSGQSARIGSAMLTWKAEEPESDAEPGTAAPTPAPGAAPPHAPQHVPKAARQPAHTAARTGAAAATVAPARRGPAGSAGRGRARLGRERRDEKKGALPGWAIALIVGLVGIGLAVGTVLVFQKSSEQASSVEGLGATATLNMAKERMEAGMYDQAAERLNRLGEGAQLTPAERDRLASLRAELVSLRERRQVLAHNMQGNRYFESRLQTYERTWLQGDPDHPKIRMFLIRCRDFRQRWPEHEGVAWIERQERRFQGVVDLDDPPTFTDITWEVKSLTGGKPKEYGEALDALADFLETAEGEDLAQAQDLQAQVVQERADYHLDRMKQARYELEEKGDDGESVRILVEDMLLMGDLDMENEAAGYLVRLPKAEAYLRGYERTDPETFDLVMQNAIVRAFAEKKGIVESGASGGAE